MCGIVGGFWKTEPVDLQLRLSRALEEMRFRGPDDRGYDLWRGSAGVVALGHTRLSIIDLTAAGHQPMFSPDGRFAVVLNGEIYNYRELRTVLRKLGHVFRSDSDTEVLLTAWAQWGQECLLKLDGMFAFVIHDRKLGKLICARDPFGIKPLFISSAPGRFLFSSTLQALLALRPERPGLNLQRSYDYLVHGDYDSDAQSFVEGINHLPPGQLTEVGLASGQQDSPRIWWKPNIELDRTLDFDSAAALVREQFLNKIRLHLRSDVAVGAALSGGIDSSSVVCAMRKLEPDLPISTFSYIATGTPFSEEEWVNRVNGEVSGEAHKVTASAADLLRDLDDMIIAQGEPFASTSIYAQYLVFRLARANDVTVILDGQGADELLSGYTGYPGQRLLSLIEQRRYYAAHCFARQWGTWPNRSYRLAAMELGRVMLPDKLYASARKLLGRDFVPAWLDMDILGEAGVYFRETRPQRSNGARGRRVIEQLSQSLQNRGLPALLRHADRNSMRFSVESRVPFLTVSLANCLLSMPEEYLISENGETKSIFRAAMRGLVPDAVLNRRDKIGFATPEKDWLLTLGPQLRAWLVAGAANAFFMKPRELLYAYDEMAASRKPFSWQLWRWVNFVRWQELTGIGIRV